MKSIATAFLLCAALASPGQQTPTTGVHGDSVTEAQALIDRGRLEEASAELQRLSLQKPEPNGVERLRGLVLYLRNDLGGAESSLTAAVRRNPADRPSSEMLGVVLYRLGKPAAAIPLLQNAHGMIPGTNVDGSYALALCLIEVHRYDEARKTFAGLYGLPPESSSAYMLGAHMFLRWEAKDAAQQAAQKALQLNPHASEAHMLLGLVALSANNPDEARLQFKQEIALNPIAGHAYEHLGDALIRKQMYVEAQEALNRAIILEPNSTGPFILLGQDFVRQGKPGLALSYLQHAAQMDPSNVLTHTTLMQAYRSLGDKEEAAKEARTVQALQAKH